MAKKETFAERILLENGWQHGEGLGKNNQGIVNPIKASLKFDKTGVGHDIAKEFTNHWWDQAFKKASNGIHIEKLTEGEIEVKSKGKLKMKAKSEKKEQKKSLYKGFVKSAT